MRYGRGVDVAFGEAVAGGVGRRVGGTVSPGTATGEGLRTGTVGASGGVIPPQLPRTTARAPARISGGRLTRSGAACRAVPSASLHDFTWRSSAASLGSASGVDGVPTGV